ncbi:MAG: Holliday junction branch migration DNA helicase RuvB [Candidatus Dojkabacteria bacterium]|uniref:Holliday junction branch migration complex subunit RuvB n=1 Tax=candidate division WS6 bacterium OLB21 TaxID=1617427 RepID=A0A136KJX0_9BACT|nr:MAG: Holliday junction ATP-dependent DNA helicase RuvB [candidate division WS6 bacterium OLB21]WKZ28352.1 MAG: Holliday junction branch migration DNA helicase RuvB [Candidatus Dojkabacteria bacterium]
MADRILDPDTTNEEEIELYEKTLRPKSFAEIIGRAREKESLQILISAAKTRLEPIDHILLHGPPGLGKTSLAHVIASEAGVQLYITSGPAIERKGDLASILTNIEPNGILFIDEIHRLNRAVEEVLYSAMEDRAIDIILGKGPAARSIRLDLNPLTIIGATTRAGSLSSPLRDRFGLDLRLDYYSISEISELLIQKAAVLDTQLESEAIAEIAARSRKTPRIAIRLLKRVRDYAQVSGDMSITRDRALQALELIGVDEFGLDGLDRKIINYIIEHYKGGPIGLQALAAALSEDLVTLQDVYEPFLLQEGFLARTPRGRVVTDKGLRYYHKNNVKD